MSSSPVTAGPTRRSRLPAWAAPRTDSDHDPAGRDVRSIETAILILVGLLLAAAVIYDVALQVRLNTRETADRATWKAFSHQNTKHLDVRTLEHGTTDYVCRASTVTGNTPEVRLCLEISGPTVNDRRHVDGGYYIPPRRADRYAYRYGCFGLPAQHGLCPATAAAAG